MDILAEFLKAVLDVPESEYERITIIDPYVKKESQDELNARRFVTNERCSQWRTRRI